VTKYVNAGVSN